MEAQGYEVEFENGRVLKTRVDGAHYTFAPPEPR